MPAWTDSIGNLSIIYPLKNWPQICQSINDRYLVQIAQHRAISKPMDSTQKWMMLQQAKSPVQSQIVFSSLSMQILLVLIKDLSLFSWQKFLYPVTNTSSYTQVFESINQIRCKYYKTCNKWKVAGTWIVLPSKALTFYNNWKFIKNFYPVIYAIFTQKSIHFTVNLSSFKRIKICHSSHS